MIYVELRVDNVDKAAQHDDKVENVPRIAKVVLPSHFIKRLENI